MSGRTSDRCGDIGSERTNRRVGAERFHGAPWSALRQWEWRRIGGTSGVDPRVFLTEGLPLAGEQLTEPIVLRRKVGRCDRGHRRGFE